MAGPICATLNAFVSRWPNDVGSRCAARYDRFLCFRGAPTAGFGGVKKHPGQMLLVLRAEEHLVHPSGKRLAALKEVTTKKKKSGASTRTYKTAERFRAPRGEKKTERTLNYQQASPERTVTTEEQYECHGEHSNTAPRHAPSDGVPHRRARRSAARGRLAHLSTGALPKRGSLLVPVRIGPRLIGASRTVVAATGCVVFNTSAHRRVVRRRQVAPGTSAGGIVATSYRREDTWVAATALK